MGIFICLYILTNAKDDKIKRELHNLEKNCKNMLNSFSKERVETEKKVFSNLSH
jgi:hypothetical protein